MNRFKRLVFQGSFVFTLLLSASPHLSADVIGFQRLDQDDIVIPAFDPSLGTLHQAILRITLRGGTTASDGTHSHGATTITSTNTRTVAPSFLTGTFSTLSTNTTVSGSGTHDFSSPNYSIGNIDIGSFTGTTAGAPSHSHAVQISSAGALRVGSNSYRWRARVSTQNAGTHAHTFDSQTNSLFITNSSQLNTLMGESDLVIAANSFDTDSDGAHNHGVNSFSVVASTNAGALGFDFPGSTTFTAGSHVHSINPRFDVQATYTFTAVPEPCSGLALLAVAPAFLFQRRRGHRPITCLLENRTGNFPAGIGESPRSP